MAKKKEESWCLGGRSSGSAQAPLRYEIVVDETFRDLRQTGGTTSFWHRRGMRGVGTVED